jgi:hypothetical protein
MTTIETSKRRRLSPSKLAPKILCKTHVPSEFRDDITRGIGQLAEALAYGYNQVALVTTLRDAKKIDSTVFDKLGLVLLGVDSKGNVQQVYPSYASGKSV